MSNVGERLRILRNGLRISQPKMAELIGTSLACVSRYETGQSSPPLWVLEWYADHFDVSMDYIFGRTDRPQGKPYKYRPKIGGSDGELQRFVEMCFDPASPVNGQLKQALVKMLGDARSGAEL